MFDAQDGWDRARVPKWSVVAAAIFAGMMIAGAILAEVFGLF